MGIAEAMPRLQRTAQLFNVYAGLCRCRYSEIGSWCVGALKTKGYTLCHASMPAKQHPSRSYVMALVRRGEITSAADIVVIAGVPRQTAYRWLKEEQSDLRALRLIWLARQHTRAERAADAKPPRRRSKTELRRMADKAIRDFNQANRH